MLWYLLKLNKLISYMLKYLLPLGHNIDAKSLRNRNNGHNSSTTGTLMSEKQKLSSNQYKYYSDISDISNGILGTIPEKVII